MSEELINHMNLNYLISKSQLQKLNKKLKETTEKTKQTNKEIYKERIIELFNKLLNDERPEDLLEEVKTAFDYYLDKTVYYFKMHDNNILLEQSKKDETNEENEAEEDEDEDKDENENENEAQDEDEAEDEDEDEDEDDVNLDILEETQNIKNKYSKSRIYNPSYVKYDLINKFVKLSS
jgi:transcriptional regulator with GAF, ATPase, and Fis domain